MLDLQRSPLAQNLAQLLADAADDVKAEAVNQMSVPPGRHPAASATPTTSAANASASGVTAAGPNDILKLATLNDDLTVSQIQAQATRLSSPAALGQEVDPRPYAR
jgi:hypothetical protein